MTIKELKKIKKRCERMYLQETDYYKDVCFRIELKEAGLYSGSLADGLRDLRKELEAILDQVI